MAGNKKVKGETRSSLASLGKRPFADAESPEFTNHTLLNGVHSSFLIFISPLPPTLRNQPWYPYHLSPPPLLSGKT